MALGLGPCHLGMIRDTTDKNFTTDLLKKSASLLDVFKPASQCGGSTDAGHDYSSDKDLSVYKSSRPSSAAHFILKIGTSFLSAYRAIVILHANTYRFEWLPYILW